MKEGPSRQRAPETEAEDDILIPPEMEREGASEDEHTPKEWREKLRGLIAGAKEKLGMSERGEKSKAYLAERSQGLQEKAKGLGPVPEKLIRSLGEKYNKLNWKYKLAISAGLIAGVGFSAVGSIPALIAGYGLVAQRGAGMAGMFVKFEKHLQKTSEGKTDGYWAKKEWYKKLAEKPEWQRKAMAGVMAAGYTGLMSVGIHEAVGLIRGDESWGGQLHEWAKGHWPSGGPEVQTNIPTDVPTESLSTENPEGGSAAAPEAPDISVDASAGHGYEYMMKRMWEQLQEKHLDPNNYAEGSDIRQLLEADAGSIDNVVHRLAADPQHGFFNADGTSVHINPDAHMTIDADGNINLNGAIHSPEGATITPSYQHTETLVPPKEDLTLPNVEESVSPISPEPGTETTATLDELTKQQAEKELAELQAENAVTPSIPEGSHEGSPISPEQETVPEASAETPVPIPATTEEAVIIHDAVPTDTPAMQPESAGAGSAEGNAAPTPEHLTVNTHGLSIDTSHANAYLDTQGNHIIFGGSLDDRAEAAKQLIAKNHSAVVYFDSTRPWWPFSKSLSMAYWVEDGVESTGIKIVDGNEFEALRGAHVPTADDLAQVYKPAN
jgi:hypothetical protein